MWDEECMIGLVYQINGFDFKVTRFKGGKFTLEPMTNGASGIRIKKDGLLSMESKQNGYRVSES